MEYESLEQGVVDLAASPVPLLPDIGTALGTVA